MTRVTKRKFFKHLLKFNPNYIKMSPSNASLYFFHKTVDIKNQIGMVGIYYKYSRRRKNHIVKMILHYFICEDLYCGNCGAFLYYAPPIDGPLKQKKFCEYCGQQISNVEENGAVKNE